MNPKISTKAGKCWICSRKFKKGDRIYILEGAKVDEWYKPKEMVYTLVPSTSRYYHQECINNTRIILSKEKE